MPSFADMDETGSQPSIVATTLGECTTHDGLNESLQAACEQIASGRSASRQIAAMVRHVGLSETEFRLLRKLHRYPAPRYRSGLSHPSKNRPALDQTSLRTELGLSAAQISMLVERMRIRGWIAREIAPEDRRRQWWRLTEEGRALLEKALAHMAANHYRWKPSGPSGQVRRTGREKTA